MGDDRVWCEFAASMLARRLERMFALMPDVMSPSGTEPIHQMRVWSRRSRSAFELILCCDNSKETQKLETELKRVASTLSKARDLDVMIQNLEARTAKLPEEQRSGLNEFVGRLSAQRITAQRDVERAVERVNEKHVMQRFNDLVGHWSK